MTLPSRQVLVTEDLKQYSLSSYDPLISYSTGNIIKDPAGSLYTCIASAPAGTLLTNTAFFSSIGSISRNGIDPNSTSLNTTGTITGKSTSINSSSISATLPTLASANLGDIYYIKVGNFTGCTLNAAGSETIDNSTALINLNPYQGITLRKANSTNWEITSDYVTFTSTGIVQSPIITTSSFQVGELAVSPTGDIYKALSVTVVGDSLTNVSKFQKITQGNQSYNASTDTPAAASIPNGTELFVETAGTQTIGGISYDLNKGDLIKKSNVGTYSVFRGETTILHIEKSANYTLTVADLPESEIVVLHNTDTTTSVDFTLPAGFTTDVMPSYVDATGMIITIDAGESLAVRNMMGNKIEIIGDGYSSTVVVPIPATTAEALAGADNSKFITPATLDDVLTDVSSQATAAKFGTTRYSTDVEAYTEVATDRSLTPSNLPAMTASASETQGAVEVKKFTTPTCAFAGYGFNDPVTKSASAVLLESEHLVLINTTGITITLPTASTIKKSKLNTVSHRVINISGGNAIVDGGVPSLLSLTKTLDPTNINAASIPTIVGGALV